MKRFVSATVVAVFCTFGLLTGVAAANNSSNAAIQCSGFGNPGQSRFSTFIPGGPAAGPDRNETPPELSQLLGNPTVGVTIQTHCSTPADGHP
jgi:hypothetical protein